VTAREIAAALGAACRSGVWWRCRCPVHASGNSSLALRDGERGLIFKCFAGCDPRDILVELRRRGLIGDSAHDRHRPLPATVRPHERDDAPHRIAMAQRIWGAAQDASETPVVHYLVGRRITIALPPVLRYAPALRRPDGTKKPAMIARIDGIDGELIGIARTWLIRDSAGSWHRHDRAMLGLAVGGAVRFTPAGETLLIGEGLETCLAAMQACSLPAWAALSTSGMVALVLPASVLTVIILADNDENGAGERAARAAAERWLAEGRRVCIAMPPEPGCDFNDLLLGRTHVGIKERHRVAT
jgi:putative DNA primase/helicase